MKKSIKDCFVTGTWRSSEDAESLLKLNDMDENLYGDYEDLETGQKFSGKNENEEEEGGGDFFFFLRDFILQENFIWKTSILKTSCELSVSWEENSYDSL